MDARRTALWVCLAALVAFGASALELSSAAGALASILAQVAFDGIALAALVGAARRASGRMRKAWVLLAIGPGLALVVIAVAVTEFALRGASTIGTAAIPPLLALNTACVVAGLVLLSPPQVRGGTAARFALDALIASLSVFFILWASLDVRQGAVEGAPAEALLTALYPASDAAAAMVVLLVLGLVQWRAPPWYRFVAASAAVVLVGDVLAAIVESSGHPGAASVAADTGFLLSLALFALAARRFDGWPEADLTEAFGAQGLPYVPFTVALLAAIYEYWENGGLAPDLFAIALVAVAAIVARTVLLLAENDVLAGRLRSSDAFKTQLLRFISHEIANPLSPLRLQASLLRDDRHGWQVVDRSLGRLESLSRDVRLMAFAETQRIVQDPKEQDVRPRVQAAANAYLDVARQRGVTVVPPTAGDEAVAPLDGERFDQVIDNLLSNALKFTPAGGTVTVTVAAIPGAVEVAVADTGAGLSQEQRERLFTAFGRVHGDTQPGLGLGLYLCRAIVEGHGGRLTVESPGPGLGCTFRVQLPAKAVEAAVRPEPVEPAPRYPGDAGGGA